VAHADRSRNDQSGEESRSGARKDPEPEPDKPREKAAEDPSELDDPDSAAEENIERLRKLGRG
jgi:hypothetical protein